MISSFQELIAPLTQAEFRTILCARVLTFRRGSGENRFAGLFDWNSFRRMIESSVLPPGGIILTRNRCDVPALYYQEGDQVNAEKLLSELDKGASVLVRALDPYVPALNALCADIRAQVAESVGVAAVITTGNGGALPTHYDWEDLFILQLEGTKRWRIYGSPMVNPVKGVPKREAAPQGEPPFNEVVRPGDSLFVPGGYWHECDNGPGRSLHLAISFLPPCGWYLVQAVLKRLPLDDDLFRVPLTRLAGPAEKAAHEMALKTRLINIFRQISFSALVPPSLH